MAQQRIFITGGASGLGRALAERYGRAGWKVCIGDVNDARGAETLAALQALGAEAQFLHCDVTDEGDLKAVAQWLEAHWSGVDIVVNNAGVAVGGGITETSLADWQWIVNINLLGVVRGCQVFTPLLAKQGGGRFVNISSMAGLIHPPMMAAYNATKAAVVALSETLRVELAADHIGVTVVCPAFFRTNLTESFRGTPHVQRITQKLVGGSKRGADDIADIVFRGVARGDFHILTHSDAAFAWMVKRLVPFPLYASFFARANRGMMPRRS